MEHFYLKRIFFVGSNRQGHVIVAFRKVVLLLNFELRTFIGFLTFSPPPSPSLFLSLPFCLVSLAIFNHIKIFCMKKISSNVFAMRLFLPFVNSSCSISDSASGPRSHSINIPTLFFILLFLSMISIKVR